MKFPLKKFLLILSSIVVCLMAIMYMVWHTIDYEEIPNLIQPAIGLQFDYIVVGAGSAGCVMARFLSQKSPNSSVLLIEAGHTFGLTSKIPLLASFLHGSAYDWSFFTTPQKYSSNGFINRQQALPRGKGLGGTSQINFLVNFVEVRKDLDKWNITNFSYDQLNPYLDTMENSREDLWEVPVRYSKLTESFENAAFGFRKSRFRRSQYNVKNGTRYSVYQKYLKPAFKFENLKILTNSIVTKVIIDEEMQAKSVKVFSSSYGVEFEIVVQKEVILSAGAYQSPHILMLSGIGPKELLIPNHIPLIYDLPQVGQNLHDHLNLPLFSSIEVAASINLRKIISPSEIWKYFKRGEGIFGNFGVFGHVDALNDPLGLTFFGVGAIDENVLMSISNYKRKSFRGLFPLYHNSSQEGFVTISNCYQPKSRGSVKLLSKDFKQPPLIDPNWLSTREDINCTIKALRLAVKVITSSGFKRVSPTILWPKLTECSNFGPYDRDFKTNTPSNKYLECVIRNIGVGSHHPGGTCAVGRVVDSNLKVYGINGLRVVDASVFPTPISGNPNAVIVAIAKRTVDLILDRN